MRHGRRARSTWLGWAAVAGFAALLAVAAIPELAGGGAGSADDRSLDGAGDGGAAGDEAAAARSFVEAWERSRTARFVATGTFERTSDRTGAELRSDALLAQDPPRRLQRQLGGTQGRDDDRLLLCPAPADDGEPVCRLGPPTGETYAASVRAEADALAGLVTGDDPLYAVEDLGRGCYRLRQRRADPRAPYGHDARLCFDGATGAPRERVTRFEGGIVERVAYDEIRPDPDPADLEP